MDFGLKESVVNRINSVFAGYPEVKQVILYGSRATGNCRNGSDIDLTIVGEAVTHAIQLRIENKLDDLLLPYKIDLSLMHEIKNFDLLDHIKRVGVVFYEKPPAATH